MACDYFIDALKDPNFALKVRERFPKDLDTALRVALQLEVWSKDVDQSIRKVRRTREIAEPEKKDEQTDMLKKQVAELQKQLAELQKKGLDSDSHQASRRTRSSSDRGEELGSDRARPKYRFFTGHYRSDWTATYGVYSAEKRHLLGMRRSRHRLWACPKLPNVEKRELYCRKICRIGVHSRPMYIVVKNSGKRHSNADGLSRRVRPPAAKHEKAVESSSESTNREKLNAA